MLETPYPRAVVIDGGEILSRAKLGNLLLTQRKLYLHHSAQTIRYNTFCTTHAEMLKLEITRLSFTRSTGVLLPTRVLSLHDSELQLRLRPPVPVSYFPSAMFSLSVSC